MGDETDRTELEKNKLSIVAFIKYDDFYIVFPGDIERADRLPRFACNRFGPLAERSALRSDNPR